MTKKRFNHAQKTFGRVPFTNDGIAKIPKKIGVYTIDNNGEKYVGSTINLQNRAKQHKRSEMNGVSLRFKQMNTRKEAYDYERKVIQRTCPTINKKKPSSCKTFIENFRF